MCPSAPRVCSEPGGQRPVLSLSLYLIHLLHVQASHIVRQSQFHDGNSNLWDGSGVSYKRLPGWPSAILPWFTSTNGPITVSHNDRDGVSNLRHLDCLFKRLFRHRSKKTTKLCVTGLWEGNPPVTGGFPSQRASNVENVSIWWRHHALNLLPHGLIVPWEMWLWFQMCKFQTQLEDW